MRLLTPRAEFLIAERGGMFMTCFDVARLHFFENADVSSDDASGAWKKACAAASQRTLYIYIYT